MSDSPSNELASSSSSSVAATATAVATTTAAPARIRSRFPKAQPNIAVSSGIARIRRISGHFATIASAGHVGALETADAANTSLTAASSGSVDRTPPLTPSASHVHSHFALFASPASNKQQAVSNTVASSEPSPSPRLDSRASTPGPLQQPPTNENVVVVVDTHEQRFSTPPQSAGTPFALIAPNTPGGSFYNQRFSNEHIMNIIKHKALQKLKKIESDALKERRKKYQREVAATAASMSTPASSIQALNYLNENSNSNSNESIESSASSMRPSVDRSKLRMRDFLYYNSKNNNNSTTSSGKKASQEPDELILETKKAPSAATEPVSTKPSTTSANIPLAPQLKIAEDGSIVLNEESLLIQREQIDAQRDADREFESTVVEGESNDRLTYNSYRKYHHTKKWSKKGKLLFSF
jgi:hypothetical protein